MSDFPELKPAQFGLKSSNPLSLYKNKVTGKNRSQLFVLPNGGTITTPRWSPNGNLIVVGHRPTGTYDGPSYKLVLIQVDTGMVIDLKVDQASNVTWGHDGKKLYYTRAILVSPPATYSVSLHGLRIQQ